MEATVDESYVQYLDAIVRKIYFVSTKLSERYPSIQTVAPELEKLRTRVNFHLISFSFFKSLIKNLKLFFLTRLVNEFVNFY